MISVTVSQWILKLKKTNIYAPNNDDPTFFNYVEDLAIINPCDYLLICGDFNLVLNPDMDCLNYKQINNLRYRQCVLTMLDNLHLIYAFRNTNPDKRTYSWHRKKDLHRLHD